MRIHPVIFRKQHFALLSLLLVAGQGFVGNVGGKVSPHVKQQMPTAEEIGLPGGRKPLKRLDHS
jgi:hypothetical protein